ncbi:MAG: hypothetical protein M3Q52_03490 [Pseudomonadota bacterium]|nr:hypothetical protein [Pseudomonadota bacterium]
MEGFANTALAITMIAAFLLSFAGVRLLLSRGDRGKGALMLAAAVVLIGNVLIWTL